MPARSPTRNARRAAWGGALFWALAGALGLVGGRGGAGDPQALLAWLVIAAPAVGVLVGARGPGTPLRLALAPVLWTVLLLAVPGGARALPAPLAPALLVVGGYGAGLGLGLAFPGAARGLAGSLVLVLLLAAGLANQGELATAGTSLASEYPRLAALAVALSPWVRAFECAGWDWTHAHPEFYARSGVEWFPRTPTDATLTASLALFLGVVLATLGFLSRRRYALRDGARARPNAEGTTEIPWP